MSESSVDIGKIFQTERVSGLKERIAVLLYCPIGAALTLVRICLTLNYVCALVILSQLFTRDHWLCSTVDRIFITLLGVVVIKHGSNKAQSKVFMCNHRSNIDGYILSKAFSALAEDKWSFPQFWQNVFGMKSLGGISNHLRAANDSSIPSVVLLPENSPSSGYAVLQFDRKYSSVSDQVQLAAVRCQRPLPVSLSTAPSSWWHDLLWMYFTPITIYHVTLSEDILIRNSDSKQDFSSRVEKRLASLMTVPLSEYSAADKKDYLKILSHNPKVNFRKTPFKLVLMTKQVQEIVPDIPEDVVMKDLKNTNSVDVTVANILEGIVQYVPIKKKQEVKPPKANNPRRRAGPMSFEEKKKEFYHQARKRYIEKHDLKID